MCGIFGEIGRTDDPPVHLIGHRGPDGWGVWRGDNVVLGHCRLAIIGLKGGRQPWTDGEGALVYNGEIYNFKELRRRLEGEGVLFRSRSDTEVLFNVLKVWGISGLELLDGMFAFGFWDGRRLLVARDRFGVKPVYWTKRGGRFAFSSEIKALLALPWVGRDVNLRALKFHLTFLWNPYPETAFRGIHKLPPGHYLVWENGEISVGRFYDPLGDYAPSTPDEDQILHTLSKSVRDQMVADVEVGLFLSGGVDSSAVAALTPKNLRAFTLVFERGVMKREIFESEERYAREVAALFGHKLTPVEVSFEREAFKRVVWHLEEPIGDGAAISNFFLSKGARDHGIKVVLTGTGGDELWGGYPRYRALLLSPLLKVLRFTPDLPFGNGRLGRLARDLKKFKSALSHPFPRNYLVWMSYFRVFEEVFEEMCGRFPKVDDPLDSAILFDVMYFLPEHNLLYTDKTSMAHGLEVRVPMLSNDTLRLALSIPSRYKVGFFDGKRILKRALEGVLPKKVLYRKKAGFGAPIKGWLQTELKGELLKASRDPLVLEILPKGEIEDTLKDVMEGRGFRYLHAFELITLSTWREVFNL